MRRRQNHDRLSFIQDALEVIQAQDRTRELRDRLLRGDAGAAALLRDGFHLTYWEHRGKQLLPPRGTGRAAAGA